jgi:CheY-like chemotaxis protein
VRKPLRVFLIDDDMDDQKFFALAVAQIQTPIFCDFANNGLEALKKLRTEPDYVPDFIFIDIDMPVMNGIECLNQIKKIKLLSNVPLYIYSSSADPHIIKSCITLGATGVIKKVPSIAFLKETLWNLFYEQKILSQ